MKKFWKATSAVLGIGSGLLGLYVSYISVDHFTIDSSYYWGISESTDASWDFSSEMTEPVADGLTYQYGNVGGALGVASYGTSMVGLAATGTGCTNVSTPGPIINTHEDSSGNIIIDDATPYCRVEKNAAKTYDALHGQKDRDYKFPAAVLETKQAMDAFADVFGASPSPRKLRETLETLERVLEKQTDERGS